jgi:putative sporulation protein YtaF
MHHFLYAFAIALANNVDNIGARIAYSIGGVKISLPINLWITAITFVISFFAAFLGAKLTGSLGAQFASLIAMVILVALGLWMIIDSLLKAKRSRSSARGNSKNILGVLLNPEKADRDHSKHIDFKEGTLLGIALSINNIGGGLCAGMMGLNAVFVAFLSAALSFVALWAGNHLAELFIKWKIADKATVVGGVILIAIGIEQFF